MINALADLLMIEKGAVYRRIRQEVPFTFSEIVTIAKHLRISLDGIMGIVKEESIPSLLRFPDYISPKNADYHLVEIYYKYLCSINQSGNVEAGSVTNVLPPDLSYEYHHISQFNLFKWNFHYTNNNVTPFHQIHYSPKMSRLQIEYAMEMKKFNKTYYIFDNRVFRLFVNDILYFNSIRLIKEEDVLKIKEELHAILDYLEEIALTGQFKETGNAASLYISDIDITTSYTYLEGQNTYFSIVRTFILAAITSTDEKTFNMMKNWIQSLIKTSTLITLTNERQRVLYFEEQRKIINEL